MEIIEKNSYKSIPNLYKEYNFPNSPHDLISLGELVEEVDKRNNINAPVWSITGNKGFIETEKR